MTRTLPLAVVGCDFRVASSAWRNALLLTPEERVELASALRKTSQVRGFVVLETCNRVEWVIDADQPRWAAGLARAQMMTRFPVGGGIPEPYIHVGEAAAEHLIRVALGMESFVLGEREIAGQLNRAMDEARAQGLASAHLGALQTTLGRAVKRVHRLTRFGAKTRGVHGLAVDTLRARLGEPVTGRWEVAVLGMGEVGKKAAELAQRIPAWRVTCANRTVGEQPWLSLQEAVEQLEQFDALIVATGARRPPICLDVADRAKPLTVIDLGAPAQVTVQRPSMAVEVLGLDDLLTQGLRPFDDRDLFRAVEFVQDAVTEFRAACLKQGVAPLLRGVWDHYDTLTHERLPSLLDQRLSSTLDEAERGRLHLQMRDELRAYTRAIIEQIESSLGVVGRGDEASTD